MSNSETISIFLNWPQAATERVSMLYFDLLINNLDCTPSRMYRRSPPSFSFLLYLYGTLKPFIWNCAIGKESSSFVSDITSKSILLYIMYVSASNLFLMKLILRWANINLSGDLNLISLRPFLHYWYHFLSQIYERQSVLKLECLYWCLYLYVLGHFWKRYLNLYHQTSTLSSNIIYNLFDIITSLN